MNESQSLVLGAEHQTEHQAAAELSADGKTAVDLGHSAQALQSARDSLDAQLGPVLKDLSRGESSPLCAAMQSWCEAADKAVRFAEDAVRAIGVTPPGDDEASEWLAAVVANASRELIQELLSDASELASQACSMLDSGPAAMQAQAEVPDPSRRLADFAVAMQRGAIMAGREIHPEEGSLADEQLDEQKRALMANSLHADEQVKLDQFESEYDRRVNEPMMPWLPGSTLGQQIMDFIHGERLSGLPVDRTALAKEIAIEILKEVSIHLLLEGAGEVLEGASDVLEGAKELDGEAENVIHDIRMTDEQFARAMSRTFPSHELDDLARTVDDIGQQAAAQVVQNPAFRQAYADGDNFTAGQLFHKAARDVVGEGRTTTSGWFGEAEKYIQTGRGGSRADLLFQSQTSGADFDFKPTGPSALRERAVEQMDRHARQMSSNMGLAPARVESRAWRDYIPDALRQWESKQIPR